mmetsp:Transcript_7900/g.31213  ORF Transcript_7900/g.31213 Transcript_7900/m.31213 type:complete len:350 (+) Transcript_7900:4402-5451(+)
MARRRRQPCSCFTEPASPRRACRRAAFRSAPRLRALSFCMCAQRPLRKAARRLFRWQACRRCPRSPAATLASPQASPRTQRSWLAAAPRLCPVPGARQSAAGSPPQQLVSRAKSRVSSRLRPAAHGLRVPRARPRGCPKLAAQTAQPEPALMTITRMSAPWPALRRPLPQAQQARAALPGTPESVARGTSGSCPRVVPTPSRTPAGSKRQLDRRGCRCRRRRTRPSSILRQCVRFCCARPCSLPWARHRSTMRSPAGQGPSLWSGTEQAQRRLQWSACGEGGASRTRARSRTSTTMRLESSIRCQRRGLGTPTAPLASASWACAQLPNDRLCRRASARQLMRRRGAKPR